MTSLWKNVLTPKVIHAGPHNNSHKNTHTDTHSRHHLNVLHIEAAADLFIRLKCLISNRVSLSQSTRPQHHQLTCRFVAHLNACKHLNIYVYRYISLSVYGYHFLQTRCFSIKHFLYKNCFRQNRQIIV